MVTDKQQTTSQELQQHLTADGSTVHCTLHAGRVMGKKPFLSTHHRYAKAHLDKPEPFWKKILWADETKVQLFGHMQMRYAW